uniref:HAT C-terminal dimerisation domain-containing protein n=1 Tax=Lactuca sativa TaxID=4236 RepID=A0A9R1W2J2_LACSA|nr:hypothetical protein LSAT_V11C300130340 [Lactuca sativa]
MQMALHAVGYFLTSIMQYSPDFEKTGWIKGGLYMCLERMCGDDENLAKMIDFQFDQFTNASELFGFNKSKTPFDWWDSYGADTPELRNFSMRILSLTCSSSGCERNWSAFEMVHSKRRNQLYQQKMNHLVYVMYNLKLNGKEEKKGKEHDQTGLETLNLDDVSFDDEWITKEESSNQYAGDEWINPLDGSSSSRPQASDGGEDDEFFERVIRDQLCAGGGRELGEDVLDLGDIDMDALFVMLDQN